MLPQIAPVIADALAQAKLVTISNDGTGAPETTTNNISSVIQTVLAAQLVSRGLLDGQSSNGQQPPIVVEAPPAPANSYTPLAPPPISKRI
jgi:flotillin